MSKSLNFKELDWEARMAHVNQLALAAPQEQTNKIDLHGLSVEQAKIVVLRNVKEAQSLGVSTIRFVPGRGNHVNAQGKRGTLYETIRSWFGEVKDKLTEIHQFDGYYEVDIKHDIPLRSPFRAFLDEEMQKFFKENIKEIKVEAEKGQLDYMLILANCYEKGIGVAQSYKNATALYLKLANEKKSPIAQYEVGCRYFIGKGIRQNDPEALRYLGFAANQGYVLAEFILGNIHWKGICGAVNYILGNKYLLAAAKRGHAEAARKIGLSYYNGWGVKVDYVQAEHWWKIGAEKGDCVAAFNLVTLYRMGPEKMRDEKKALFYLQRSAELGDPDGQHAFAAHCYFDQKNQAQGITWFKTAAKNGADKAAFFLFTYFIWKKEKKLAQQYLIQAGENGNIEAQFILATSKLTSLDELLPHHEEKSEHDSSAAKNFNKDLQERMTTLLLKQSEEEIASSRHKDSIIELLLCEENTKKQIGKALRILKKSANENCTYALARLGALYIGGHKKIKKNVAEAHKYWLRGAELGDRDCFTSLGYFWEGKGGKVDFAKALDYYTRAAIKGCANAENQLGVFYRDDQHGAKKNLKTAVQHFERAMELDKPEDRAKKKEYYPNVFKFATKNLAQLYFRGGVDFPKDENKAIELFKKSAEDGAEDVAFFLFHYLFKKDVMSECIFYLKIAAKLKHPEAMIALQEYESLQEKATPSSLNKQGMFKAVVEDKEAKKTQLQKVSKGLSEQLDWKISDKKEAWAYISLSFYERAKEMPDFEKFLKKTKDGRCLIVVTDVYRNHLKKLEDFLSAMSKKRFGKD